MSVDDDNPERTEEALAASKAQMGALLDAAVDAIMTMDERGAILAFNPAAERMFGYAAEEVIGQNVKILMPSPFREEHDGYIARYLATGEARVIGITREGVALRKDGTVFPVELSVAEARLGDWRVFVGIHRDISERKRAEEKFRLTVEAAPYAMVMVDHHGEIVLVNQQTEKLFGYTRHELLGQPVEVLVPERFRAKHPFYRSEFLANPEARSLGVGHELHARRKDGSEFPVEIGLNPVKTVEGLLVLSAIVDITERKRAEEARRQSEGSLREQAGVLEHAQVLVRGPEDRIILWSQGGGPAVRLVAGGGAGPGQSRPATDRLPGSARCHSRRARTPGGMGRRARPPGERRGRDHGRQPLDPPSRRGGRAPGGPGGRHRHHRPQAGRGGPLGEQPESGESPGRGAS